MFYNEDYEARRQLEESLMKKWHKAIEVNNITDEHKARTTALLLENYLEHLHSDPRLIAEDQIQTGAFTGVNLALLGLIARVIPNIIGLELVGSQAMPTPTSPIFTMRWYKSNNKGETNAGDEMWVSPVPSQFPVGLDPYYSSQQIREEDWVVAGGDAPYTLGFANSTRVIPETSGVVNPLLYANSMFVKCYKADGTLLTSVQFVGDYNTSGSYPITGTPSAAFGANMNIKLVLSGTTKYLQAYDTDGSTACNLTDLTVGGVAVASAMIEYEYKPEAEGTIPEIHFAISQENVSLIRRQLRGKYTLDAAYDLKKLHGIDLESELLNMMKQELMAEINREIVTDLRMMAGITRTLDYALLPANVPGASSTATQMSINANWNDAHLALLDAIEKVCAVIWNVGRRGYGNFVVGNPETLSFLDRVPGFVGSGVTYNGRDLNYAGSLGGKIKFYHDVLYPKNELLIGFKGTGALDTGYMYCPYLPITATPTLLNPETGNPSKIFYTRYGKTYYDRFRDTYAPKNLILMGEYQYARLTIANMPTMFAS